MGSRLADHVREHKILGVTSGGGGASALNDLSDVNVPSPSLDEVLTWTGSSWTAQAVPAGVTDHGALTGLTHNDHPQYIDGSLAYTGDLNMGGNSIVSVGNVDGRDVSADGASLDAHVGDSDIHFTEASIDHNSILNNGTNTHADIDNHISSSSVHFTESSIDHDNILNNGTNSHTVIDNHLSSTSNPHSVTAAQAGADPTGTAAAAVSAHAGTNTHTQIDTHIADNSIHAAISGGSANQIAFFTAAEALSSDVDLYWDNVGKRLGLGLTSPEQKLHMAEDGDAATILETAGSSTSPDLGIFQRSLPSSGMQYDAAYDGSSLWAVCGASGRIWTSSDRITWTEQTTPTSSTLYAIAYGQGRWVAMGSSSTIITSTDGTTWTTQTAPASGRTMRALKFFSSSNTWLGCNSNGRVWSSTNGTSWTETTVNTSVLFRDVAYNGTTYVTVGQAFSGNAGRIYSATSPTGTWTERTNPGDSGDALFGVDYNGLYFFAVGQDFSMSISGNGTSWTVFEFNDNYTTIDDFLSIAADPVTGLICLGTDGSEVFSSDDHGGTWEVQTIMLDFGDVNGIGFGDGHFVYCGSFNNLINEGIGRFGPTDSAEVNYFFRRAQGTLASPTVINEGTILGTTLYQGYDGSAYLDVAKIQARVHDRATVGANDLPGTLDFYVNCSDNVMRHAMTISATRGGNTSNTELSNDLLFPTVAIGAKHAGNTKVLITNSHPIQDFRTVARFQMRTNENSTLIRDVIEISHTDTSYPIASGTQVGITFTGSYQGLGAHEDLTPDQWGWIGFQYMDGGSAFTDTIFKVETKEDGGLMNSYALILDKYGNLQLGSTASADPFINGVNNDISPRLEIIRTESTGSGAHGSPMIYCGETTTDDPYISLGYSTTRHWNFGIDRTDGTKFKFGHSTTTYDGVETNTVMTLDPANNNVGIGTASPNASSALEVAGTKALLLPRLTTTERNALTATDGMIIYNTTTSKFQGRAGGAWVDLH